ncbi:hypothetical protein ACNJN1_24420, partial [Citrobacter freundii]
MAKRASARGIRRDVSGILRAPRRMQVADAVSTYMRVPMGAGNSVPWDPDLAPYLDRTFRCSPEVKSRLSPRRNDNNGAGLSGHWQRGSTEDGNQHLLWRRVSSLQH